MFTLLFDETGLAALSPPDATDAETLIQQKMFLRRIAKSLQQLDAEIKRVAQRQTIHGRPVGRSG